MKLEDPIRNVNRLFMDTSPAADIAPERLYELVVETNEAVGRKR